MRINELATPCYVIDEGRLTDNLKILNGVMQRTGAKILLAQKAFSAFCEYPLIGRYLSGTTASGLYEARLAHEEMGKENHVFCPAFLPEEMDELVEICDHIVFNSVSQYLYHLPKIQAAKSKKKYDLDENGERIRLPSGRYKTHKIDLTGWNDKDNTLLWRKAWADFTNDFLERNGSPERIDHRSNAERGIDEIPTVHMGVAACQMEKKGIATEKGELNRSIQKTNRLIREIRAQIGKLKEWIADLFKAWETAPEQPPQSPNLANLLMKYLSVQREKSRKYSQRWQQQHTADELKTIAAAVNYLSEHGISNLDELDASLSSVSDRAYSIREGMKTAEQRMKELQKLMEYGRNYQTYKPIHDELKKLQNGWTNKRDKYEEAHRAELTLWNAANRYLHANLPKGTKTLPIAEWEQEYADLKTQRDSDYTKLKDTRAEVAELQKIRRCVDIALRADQPEQTQSRTKRHEQER